MSTFLLQNEWLQPFIAPVGSVLLVEQTHPSTLKWKAAQAIGKRDHGYFDWAPQLEQQFGAFVNLFCHLACVFQCPIL